MAEHLLRVTRDVQPVNGWLTINVNTGQETHERIIPSSALARKRIVLFPDIPSTLVFLGVLSADDNQNRYKSVPCKHSPRRFFVAPYKFPWRTPGRDPQQLHKSVRQSVSYR